MKNWVLGRRLMDEQPGDEGGGGGGGAGGDQGGAGGAGDQGGAGGKGGEDKPDDKGDEEHANALGEELNKGEQQPGDKPKGDQSGASADKPTEGAPTEAEAQAYKEALKLDEAEFGKDQKFDERYVEKLPALFKKHGLDPAKANALANDFAKLQKEVEKGTTEKLRQFREWRNGELKKMNDAYHATYDQAGRADIARAITHFFPKGSPMFQAVCMTEVGVDPGFLKAMKFIGERLAKDAAPGAAAGAGSGGGKSLSDAFMGL